MGGSTAEGITKQGQWRDDEADHASGNPMLHVLQRKAQVIFNATNA
jgi:hypothetical protein